MVRLIRRSTALQVLRAWKRLASAENAALTDGDKLRAYASENHSKLDACSGHSFEDMTPDRQLGKRFTCANCLGEIDPVSLGWYLRGRKDAV